MADETVKTPETDEKTNPFRAEADKTNLERAKNKGLRVKVGFTRGKGSLPIKWEAFDETIPESMPVSLKEFNDLTGTKTEAELLEYAIVGFNDAQYTAASDPIAEHVNPLWDADTKSQFRLVVRNMSKVLSKSIDDVVAMIKPGVEAAAVAKAAAAKGQLLRTRNKVRACENMLDFIGSYSF